MGAAAILFATTLALAAPKPLPGMTVEHISQLRSAYNGQISPDGDTIVWQRVDPRHPGKEDDGAYRTSLHATSLTDGTTRPLVTRMGVRGVRWASDSRSLTFVARAPGGKHAIWRLPMDGGEAQPILESKAAIGSYAVSPDGATAWWVAAEAEDAETGRLRNAGFVPEVYEEQLQYARVWRAPTGAPVSPWSTEPAPAAELLPIDDHVASARLSPDGSTLLLVRAPTPLVDDSFVGQRIALHDATSGRELAVFDRLAKLGRMAWAPDSQHVAAVMGEDLADPREGRLVVGSRDGTLRDLLPDLQGHVGAITWRDADTVVYVADMGTQSLVGEVDLDGTTRTLIAPGVGIWHGVSLSDDGTLVLTGDTAQHPSEVFVLEGQTPRRLTDVNPWLADVELARQETVTWKARDGLEIEGVLLHPLRPPKKGGSPLILMVHGGPEAHVSDGWVTDYGRPAQAAAAAGFALLFPNYRSSTGRGVAFSRMGQRDQAGAEFDDLVDAIAPLAERGLVDPERVGLTGRSYGGYAAAWAATKLTDHFAAAVMGVGISDQVSKFGTTDIPHEAYHSHSRVWPWEDWDYFRQRSPVTWVEGADTPLLILHGKEDPRVHPSQGLELYRYLSLIGEAPVRLIYYPGEGHGNVRAASRYDYALRVIRWFEHFLVDEAEALPDWSIPYGLDGASPAEAP